MICMTIISMQEIVIIRPRLAYAQAVLAFGFHVNCTDLRYNSNVLSVYHNYNRMCDALYGCNAR